MLTILNGTILSEVRRLIDKFDFVEALILRTIISTVIIIVASVIGAFLGMGMNEPLNGAILFGMIAGFACTINAIEKNQKRWTTPSLWRGFLKIYSTIEERKTGHDDCIFTGDIHNVSRKMKRSALHEGGLKMTIQQVIDAILTYHP